MAISQADLDRLERALATGTLSVEVEGKRVTYRTVDQLKMAIDYVRGELSAAAGTGSSVSFAGFRRS